MKDRTAAEVTSVAEVRKIAAAYQPGAFGYEQIEKKFGLRAANGMTAYRICQKAKKMTITGCASKPTRLTAKQPAQPSQPAMLLRNLRPSQRRPEDYEDDAPPPRRRRCIIKGCGTWLNTHNEDSDGRCSLCQQRRLDPNQSLPSRPTISWPKLSSA